MRVHGVVLAAGRGRRMGGPKHLLSLPREPTSGDPGARIAPSPREPLLTWVLRSLCEASVYQVTCVLRPGDAAGERLCRSAGAQVAFAWPAGEGRAASVRAAVRATPDADGWLFALCDQPFLRPTELRALVRAFEEDPSRIVCASYAGRRGSPTLLPAALRAELLELRGEEGGRTLIRRHPHAVLRVELDPERGRDLDTPADVVAAFGVDLPLFPGTMPPHMTQRTLSIVKPDAVSAHSTGAILQAIEESGLRIVALRMLQLTPEQAEAFYAVHRERPFFKSLCEFMISGPIVVSALEGDDAIQRYRTLMGATNPEQAAEGTLRKRFATNVERNAVHGSDAPETARDEIRFFFPDLG